MIPSSSKRKHEYKQRKDKLRRKKGLENLSSRVTGFPQFQELPSEIQIQIWEHALTAIGPRMIHCQPMNYILPNEERITKCIATISTPSLLHSCVDSRAIASKRYRPSFGAELKTPVYFDESRDTLQFAHLQAAAIFLAKMAEDENSVWGQAKQNGTKHRYIALDPSFHFSSGHLPRRDYFSPPRVGNVASKLGHFQEVVVFPPIRSESQAIGDLFSTQENENQNYAKKIQFFLEGMQSFDAAQVPKKEWDCPRVTYLTREEFWGRGDHGIVGLGSAYGKETYL